MRVNVITFVLASVLAATNVVAAPVANADSLELREAKADNHASRNIPNNNIPAPTWKRQTGSAEPGPAWKRGPSPPWRVANPSAQE